MELAALNDYLSRIVPDAARLQELLLLEVTEGDTQEANFVRAVDKLASMIFVIQCKGGDLQPQHLRFTLTYGQKIDRVLSSV